MNPLLQVEPANPECPTGWHAMEIPPAGYQGHSKITLQAGNVLRVLEEPERSPRVVARLYHPHSGDVVGLYTDRSEFKMLGKAGRHGKLMADAAGVALLKRKLPWGTDPIPMDKTTLLGTMGLKHYPFSVLSHVLVTDCMPSDLLAAMVKAYNASSLLKYGGLPVLALPTVPDGKGATDLSGLSEVRWPDNITLLATSSDLADQIADRFFELDVEEYEL